MFEKFSAESMKIVMLAHQEARRLGHSSVGTELILLGLIAENTGTAGKALEHYGINIDAAKKEIEKLKDKDESAIAAGDLPFTGRANRALELSCSKALEIGANKVQTEHILLGLIANENCTAAKILKNLGLPLRQINMQRLLSFQSKLPQSTFQLVNTDSAIESNPKDARSYVNRALRFERLARFDQVIEDCSQALEMDDKYLRAYSTRACAYMNLAKYAEAIADLNIVIEQDPRLIMAYLNRGLAHERSGNYQLSIEDCDKIIELNPQHALAFNNRGVAYTRLRKHELSLCDYNKAIELDPTCCLAYANRGGLHKHLAREGITEKDKIEAQLAIDDFTLLIERYPEYMAATIAGNRADCFMLLKQHGKALDDTTKSLEAIQRDKNENDIAAWVHVVSARARLELKQSEKAIDDCNRALELSNNMVYALNVRASIYEKINQHDKAYDDFVKVLELDSKNTYAAYGKARANFKLNFEDKLFQKGKKSETDSGLDNL